MRHPVHIFKENLKIPLGWLAYSIFKQNFQYNFVQLATIWSISISIHHKHTIVIRRLFFFSSILRYMCKRKKIFRIYLKLHSFIFKNVHQRYLYSIQKTHKYCNDKNRIFFAIFKQMKSTQARRKFTKLRERDSRH